MNLRMIAMGLTAFLLCGCSTWNSAMSYVGLRDSEQSEPSQPVPARTEVVTSPIPAMQSTESATWCQQIAKSARDEAAGNGFDSRTQRRRAESAYRQCVGSPSR